MLGFVEFESSGSCPMSCHDSQMFIFELQVVVFSSSNRSVMNDIVVLGMRQTQSLLRDCFYNYVRSCACDQH